MPQRKKQTVQKAKRAKSVKARSSRSVRAKKQGINWTESYSSFLLGVVVVIVVILFGVTIIRQQSHIQQTSAGALRPGRVPAR